MAKEVTVSEGGRGNPWPGKLLSEEVAEETRGYSGSSLWERLMHASYLSIVSVRVNTENNA